MAKKKKGPVFRVTGLRAEQSDEDLDTALGTAITENLSDNEQHFQFTTALVPSCNDDLRKVALVEFHDGIPNFLLDLVKDPLDDFQIEMGKDDITFDRHFFGFTQLYTPKPDTDITADIIAITGLDGHAYGSWRSKKNLGRMWLRDFLSEDLPCCRTMIYGYNSKLSSRGISKITDYGRELMEELKKIRCSEQERQRPLFLIAHSFGGIILAHCLIKAAQTNEEDHPTIAAFHKATYGMLLFGIPHKGLVVDDIQKILAHQENSHRSALLQQIRKESDLLESQLVDFKNLIRDRKVVSFYETRTTRQLQFNSDTERWQRTGEPFVAVDTDSALLQLPDHLEEKIPVDADHSMIVKFDGNTSKTYISVRDKLRQFEKEAPNVIAARFCKNGPKPTIMIPFQQDSDFVGREGVIANIFELHQTDKHVRVALTGLGGVGKSQIAIEYAYRFRESVPQAWVFWVHAANTSRFEEAYRAIADKVEIPERDNPKVDIFKIVHNWLADERNGRWLLILDNADDDGPFFDPDRPLEGFLPQTPNGKLLVTSRKRSAATNLVGSQGHTLEVKPMGEDDALTLLSTRGLLNESNQDDSKALVQALEYIPLAITHAAACIKASALMTMADYIRRFEESEAYLVKVLGKEEYKDIRRDNSIRHAVIATWQISFAQIQETEPSAADLLALMSMFDRQGIPVCLLRKACSETVDLDDLLTVLVDFSLVRIEIRKESVGMHRLVQLSMNTWLKHQQTTPQTAHSRRASNSTGPRLDYATWAREAVVFVADVYPLHNFENGGLCSKYLPHAYAVLKNDGRLEEAEDFAVQAVEASRKVFGDDDHSTSETSKHLGLVYKTRGRYKEAEEPLLRCLERYERVYGDKHHKTQEVMTILGSTYLAQGRWKRAEELLLQATSFLNDALGEDHPRAFLAMQEVTWTFMRQQRWAEAERIATRVLAFSKMRLVEGHPEALMAMQNLGTIYQYQGQLEKSKKILTKVLQMSRKVLGEEHPDVLMRMSDLARLSYKQNIEETEKVFVYVEEVARRVLGMDHPHRLSYMFNLATAWATRGKNGEAVALVKEWLQNKITPFLIQHYLTMDIQSDGPFPYQPLKSAEIRLLQVQPGTSDLISVDLHTVETPACQTFWALSYVWGSREGPAVILLNGQPFSITRNLYNALFEYRRHAFKNGTEEMAFLWVDAICINQNDNVEKSLQVPRMSDIYGKCQHVLAWLGPVENEDEKSICKLAEKLKEFKSPVNEDIAEDDRIKAFMKLGKLDEGIATQVELVRKALKSIGHRPWFRRIWILQEAVLAQNSPILLCGQYELGYDILFKTWVLMLNPSEDGQLLYSFMAENPVRFKAIEVIYKRILRERSPGNQGEIGREKQCALDVFKLLSEATELEATVSHDRLYALIGLLACDPLPKAIKPDYAKPLENLCHDLTVFILQETNDIRALNLGTVGNFSSVPSWTPDIRNSWTARANLGNALGGHFHLSPDGNTLTLPAIILGQCVSVSSPVKPDLETGIMTPSAFLKYDEDIISPVAAIRQVTRMEVMIEWLKHHFADIYTEERLVQDPSILQRIMLAYTCMVHNQPISALGTRYGSAQQLEGAFGMVTDPIIQRSLIGCSSFVLQDGMGGSLLHDGSVAAVGDAICVFQGLSVPFLIRSDDGKKCRVIGQVSKWENNGSSLPEEVLGSYQGSFEGYYRGKETEHSVRMTELH
ncbi:hypothetical protein FIE12Z_3325 [Fusarium flagelliforme]|uniref:Uncharacterized protein n=1 Tax=Fusarium flagelliforme TaxID=2675880 RepID=A0A395MWX8_9HYPO|nr:hypothetical protein FIE12Z_3325 [Fusarium flagelliforme]